MGNNPLNQGLDGREPTIDRRPDTSTIDALINQTRRLLRSTWVATGLGVSIGLLLAALFLVTITDLAISLWPLFRLVGLLLIVVPSAWVFFLGVIRPMSRRLTAVLVARRIEREIPGIHNRLVSCVDLDRQGHGARSRAFHRRLITEAVERIRGFRPRQVLDLVSLRRASVFAAVSVVLVVLAFVLFSNRLPTAVARIFRPFADIPPASGVVYHVLTGDQLEPGDYETLRGDDVDFTVVLRKGEVAPGQDEPFRLAVHTVDEEGATKTLWYDFDGFVDRQTTLTLTGMRHSFVYRVHGGGTWSKQFKVTMLDRPKIMGLQTVLHYPDYMKMNASRTGSPQSVDVIGPKESMVEVLVQVEGDAVEGEIQLLQPRSKLVKVAERPPRPWFTDSIPEGAKAEGDWKWDEALAERKSHFDPASENVHVHGFHSSPLGFEVRNRESLFADVFLLPDEMPETIMLKWHDGEGWEHRAYWGLDKIAEGKLDTASRRSMGELPEPGSWVRLEIPANLVDLEQKRLHGISFAQFGGRCIWGAAGALPAGYREVREIAVVESRFLLPVDDPSQTAAAGQTAATAAITSSSDVVAAIPNSTMWRGSFPLMRDGFYRVELRNKIGYANPQMQEGKLTAIIDKPPQVAIDQPGADLIVSAPVKVPLYVSAFDDFGLADIVLSTRVGDSGGFRGRPVRTFEQPRRHASSFVTIDMAAENLKLGDTIAYRVEARDTRGQTAATRDFTVRIAEQENAADRQYATFEQKTEAAEQKLVQLVEQQAQVQETVDLLAEKFGPLTEKIEQAKADAAKKAEADENEPPTEPIQLDEETAKQLAELRGELAKAVQQEDQSIQLSKQVSEELKQLAEQSPNVQFLPPEIAQQLQNTSEAFEQTAVGPLEQLGALIKQGAAPDQTDPQLPNVQRQGEQVQDNLEALQERLEALGTAQRESREDAERALIDLRDRLLGQEAGMISDDLADLRDYIEAIRAQLGDLQGDQIDLFKDSELDVSKRLFEKLLEEQRQLDVDADEQMSDAGQLLDQLRQLADEPLAVNHEGDVAEDLEADGESDADQAEASDPNEAGGEPEPLFEPALGGEMPAMDPQLADLKRRANRNEQSGTNDPQRDNLRSHQIKQAEQLDAAERALGADQQKLESLLGQLDRQADGQLSPKQSSKLAELMRSEDVRQARSMFERLQQMMGTPAPEQLAEPDQAVPASLAELPPASDLLLGDRDGAIAVEAILLEIDDLDLNSRTAIMKMQPKVREELLQGLREDGPEGYREFIRDYFRRLTKVQGQ